MEDDHAIPDDDTHLCGWRMDHRIISALKGGVRQ